MAGRNVPEAWEAFRDPLQAALSCVTRAIVISSGPLPPPGPHALRLSEEPFHLGRDLLLSVAHSYVLLETGRGGDRWQIQTTSYSYRLSDIDGRELVVYQWDPNPASRSPVTFPHVHVGRSLAHPNLPSPFRERVGRLVKVHLPTGHITLTAILRAAIDDLGVEPLRPNWETRLAAADAVLRASLD